jgi:hypothetical protein
MPRAGFEPAFPATKRPQTDAFFMNSAVTWECKTPCCCSKFLSAREKISPKFNDNLGNILICYIFSQFCQAWCTNISIFTKNKAIFVTLPSSNMTYFCMAGISLHFCVLIIQFMCNYSHCSKYDQYHKHYCHECFLGAQFSDISSKVRCCQVNKYEWALTWVGQWKGHACKVAGQSVITSPPHSVSRRKLLTDCVRVARASEWAIHWHSPSRLL